MNKLELIQDLKDTTDLSKPEAAAVVDIFFNGMAEELAKGGSVEIRGLCRPFSTLNKERLPIFLASMER
jgi:integration host factor subunit beta